MEKKYDPHSILRRHHDRYLDYRDKFLKEKFPSVPFAIALYRFQDWIVLFCVALAALVGYAFFGEALSKDGAVTYFAFMMFLAPPIMICLRVWFRVKFKPFLEARRTKFRERWQKRRSKRDNNKVTI